MPAEDVARWQQLEVWYRGGGKERAESAARLEKEVAGLKAVVADLVKAREDARQGNERSLSRESTAFGQLLEAALSPFEPTEARRQTSAHGNSADVIGGLRLGGHFVAWCREANVLLSRVHLFARRLSDRGYETVDVTPCVCANGMVSLVTSAQPTSWVVQIGEEAWMLPHPMSAAIFSDTTGFDADTGVAPKSLASCGPAQLQKTGDGWAILARGHLFA